MNNFIILWQSRKKYIPMMQIGCSRCGVFNVVNCISVQICMLFIIVLVEIGLLRQKDKAPVNINQLIVNAVFSK
jgi:hypothetical protein